jgi:phosphoglycolate phosphatase-like HAD superfamily hydrolase
MMLKEINEKYHPIKDLETLVEWAEHTSAFSEESLLSEIEKHPESDSLQKALLWSRTVNSGIINIPESEKIAFPGVREALKAAKDICSIAIVSSANRKAMEEEWIRCGLMDYVDYSMAQDTGTKKMCIESMIKKGFDPDHILMIGDAVGDKNAAFGAGVMFFPIMAAHETESWKEFSDNVLQIFTEGKYGKELQKKYIDTFEKNLDN